MPKHRHQLVIHVGPAPSVDAVKLVELTPSGSTAEAVLDALRASKLNASDLRSQVLVSLDCEPALAVLVYTALASFATRRLDLVVAGELIPAVGIDNAARKLPDAGKPERAATQLQGGGKPHDVLPSVVFAAALTPEQTSEIRYARRVRLVPSPTVKEALIQFLVVAGLRARGRTDRFPFLCDGSEPAPAEDAQLEVFGICLDTLRAKAVELRREHRSGDRDALAEPADPSSRQMRLIFAANVEIEDAMRALGGRQNPDTGLWHCPRPDRHTNGDANASMRTFRGKVRCYRCDGERVDSLRLAVDVLGCTPDEAAEWLLTACAAPAGDVVEELSSVTPEGPVAGGLTDLFD